MILHLPVHSEQINNDFVEDQYLTYNPEIPGSPKGVGSSKFDVYESTKADNIKMERLTSKKVEVDIDVTDIDIGDKKIIDSSGLYKKDDLDIEFKEMIGDLHKTKTIAECGDCDNINTKPETHSDLMSEFKDSNKTKQWPSKTNIYCFWCVFPFNNTPCAIPKKYIEDTFYVYMDVFVVQSVLLHIFLTTNHRILYGNSIHF